MLLFVELIYRRGEEKNHDLFDKVSFFKHEEKNNRQISYTNSFYTHWLYGHQSIRLTRRFWGSCSAHDDIRFGRYFRCIAHVRHGALLHQSDMPGRSPLKTARRDAHTFEARTNNDLSESLLLLLFLFASIRAVRSNPRLGFQRRIPVTSNGSSFA